MSEIELLAIEERQQKIRQGYISWLASLEPYLFLTVSFDFGTQLRVCREQLNKLLMYINERTLSFHYKKQRRYLSGYVVEEFNSETAHYHIVFSWSKSLRDFEHIEAVVDKCVAKIRNPQNGKRLIESGCWKLKPYFYDRLEDYLTKNFRYLTLDEAIDSTYQITIDGCQFEV